MAGGSGVSSAGNDDSAVRLVSNIFISFIGAGVLGLPYAFKEAGLLEGAIVMAAVAYLSVRAMLLLIDCKYCVAQISLASADANEEESESEEEKETDKYVEIRIEPTKKKRSLSRTHFNITYSDVGFAAFGAIGKITVDTALLVSQVGFCCAYLIFISENLASFVHGLTQAQWLAIILPPLFLMTLVPDLSNLAIFSLLAQFSNLLAFAVVFWFDFDHLHLASREHRREFSLAGFPFFFSVAIYCFEGAGMILALEGSASDTLRPQFRRYFVATLVSVTMLYVTFGVSGYLSYGADTKDIITLNLPISEGGPDFAALVKACLSFSLFFTYPVMMFPVTTLLEERIVPKTSVGSPGLQGVVLRLTLVATTGLIVTAVPRFADLMALVGATCCTMLAFIMPGLSHFVLSRRVTKNPPDPTMNYVLVVVGILGAVLGTLDALKKIIS